MFRSGLRLRLGTDGAASNDSQDLLETAKMALCLARAAECDPEVLSPSDVLSWATDGQILAPGGQADIIMVNLDTARSAPVNDTTSALVLSASAADVDTVMVGGDLVVENRRVKGVDEKQLRDACRSASKSLKQRVGLS
jgi:5-methylthioadenosine/S-adenosylhomocysteine deaminase